MSRGGRGGDSGAQYAVGIGLIARNQEGDRTAGAQWLEKAAAAGNPAGMFALAGVLLGDDAPAIVERGRVMLRQSICWLADMKWTKIDREVQGPVQMKVVIAADAAQVFAKRGDEWTELKPGKFKTTQLEESLILSSFDAGWDQDGKWIESATVQLLRTGPNEATIAFFRTVNNPHMPAELPWRTFTTLAEGKATRQVSK